MTAWSWKPDRLTRAAIRRGDKYYREYIARKTEEYRLASIARVNRRNFLPEKDRRDGLCS